MPNTPNLDLEEPNHGAPDWDTPLNSNFTKIDAGVVVNTPTADQTITGAHSLTLSDSGSNLTERGTAFFGIPFSSLSTFAQGNIGPASAFAVNMAALQDPFLGGALQVVSDDQTATGSTNAIEAFSSAEATVDSGVFSGISCILGNGYLKLNGHSLTNYFVCGIQGGNNFITGPGTVHVVTGVEAGANGSTGAPTIDINTAYYSFQNQDIGTINAQYYGEDQGSGASNYGIYLAGSTHNNLGGGQTKVGGLHITLAGVSIRANNAAAIAAGLVAGDLYRTGGDPDILCIVH